ncbi:hypothetical protein ABK040_008731 [Willaertia magna]
MKINYLIFLFKDNNDQIYNFNNIQNLFNKIENNFIEICWIFNKNEIFTTNSDTLQNTLQNSDYHLLIYNQIKELITKNDLILNNTNLNSIFRIHGLLYLNKNNELSFDILNIINLQQDVNFKKIINSNQMSIVNKNINEIIFQNIIKGNLNIYLQYKHYNSYKNDNLISAYNNYSLYRSINLNFGRWFNKVNLKFNPLKKDEFIIKCYPSFFRLIDKIFYLENILFILFEFIIYYFGYLFTFKLTKDLMNEIEFTIFKISFSNNIK